jgi:hypothetical protein
LAFCYQLFAAGAPWKWISHIFLPSAAENDFLKFKGRGLFKFSKKYSAAKHYTDIYRLVLVLTHLSFSLGSPFKVKDYRITGQICN